uniref:Uncharacterized protein n=1 Tax=Mesocestoides corti TaxID=53468 RepID=A0A5K3G2U1_MESCO
MATDLGADIKNTGLGQSSLSGIQWHARKKCSQPERHEWVVVYVERRGQRSGLGWKTPDVWLCLVIGQ